MINIATLALDYMQTHDFFLFPNLSRQEREQLTYFELIVGVARLGGNENVKFLSE